MHTFVYNVGTAEVLQQVLEAGDEKESDNDSVFHSSDESDDDDDNDEDFCVPAGDSGNISWNLNCFGELKPISKCHSFDTSLRIKSE